jgi:hypothetical protein
MWTLVTEVPPLADDGQRISDYERWPDGGKRPTTYVLLRLAKIYATTVASCWMIVTTRRSMTSSCSRFLSWIRVR